MFFRLTLLISFCTALCFAEEQEDLLLSTPDQIASTAYDNLLIGGVVSPFSGQLCLQEIDLIVKGAEPLTLKRTYIPPYMPCSFHEKKEYDTYFLYEHLAKQNYGWTSLPHTSLFVPSKGRLRVRVRDEHGIVLEYRIDGGKTGLNEFPYGISNTRGDIPSGAFDPRNTRISYLDRGKTIVVSTPNGTRRTYIRTIKYAGHGGFYALTKERLPSGRIIKYKYPSIKSTPHLIESLSPSEQHTYASLHISAKEDGSVHATSSTGQQATYFCERRRIKGKITSKEHGVKNSTHYDKTSQPLLTAVSSPFYRKERSVFCDRFLLSEYYGKTQIFHVRHGDFKSHSQPKHYRIDALSLPVGENDTFQITHRLGFNLPIPRKQEGVTTVLESDGSKILYHISKQLLLTKIQFFDPSGALRREKQYTWSPKNLLESIEEKDGAGHPIRSRIFVSDDLGNPHIESFVGNLTSSGPREIYSIFREYSQDGYNLLLREVYESGKKLSFKYLPDTNLVTAKFIKENKRILQREFFIYDTHNNLIQKILDDGQSEDLNNLTGVTQRTSTHYHLRKEQPFLHMPECIEETYLAGTDEKLVKKTNLFYDQEGNVIREEIYDADAQFAYSLEHTYNERGDLLSSTNPLGQKALYAFDEKGRRTFSTSFSQNLHTHLEYDTKGRLKKTEETGSDITHTTLGTFDTKDHLTLQKDHFGNPTRYSYDPLSHKVTKTDFPEITSSEGTRLAVSTSSTYDSLGRETSHTDANGNTTHFRYNAYGSPIEIIHPEGSKETFLYYKNGELKSHTDADGLTLSYTRDIFDRVLKKEYFSQNKLLAQETFRYSTFQLLESTDKEGIRTTYTYDASGQKIREQTSDKVTEYFYDALGRINEIHYQNQENTLCVHYKRDLLGRILEESKTDLTGKLLYKISYTFDAEGNQSSVTRYLEDTQATETFTYDAFQRETVHIDPLGEMTATSYDENSLSSLNQRILQVTTRDPHQKQHIQTFDVFNNLVQEEKKEAQGELLSSDELFYDPACNLIAHKQNVIEKGTHQKTITTAYAYNSRHRLDSMTRASSTPDARTTLYTYTPAGKLHTKTLPDGTTLNYSYTPLGYLTSLTSSDGTIDHSFVYNNQGHLLEASDRKQEVSIHRTLDPFGNVLTEDFDRFSLHKTFDAFSRCTKLSLPDNSAILYKYDPLFLREISRSSSTQEPLYSHSYLNYDLSGRLLSEEMINNLGIISHSYDRKGRKEKLSSPYFSEQYTFNACDELISLQSNDDLSNFSYDGLSQLTSEQTADQLKSYSYDSNHNRTEKEGIHAEINNLDELQTLGDTSCIFDPIGNQIQKTTAAGTTQFVYDPLNRLIEATTDQTKICFTYDPLDRRLSKSVYSRKEAEWHEIDQEFYLYHGNQEIGALDRAGHLKQLCVPGSSRTGPVSIELGGKIYAPLIDYQKNIRQLIDLSQSLTHSYHYSAFGETLNAHERAIFNPWRFASKRLDPELGLLFFGSRYYDPELARWLTTDPAGFTDSRNLYQYVLNNPYGYYDPNGQFIIAIPLLIFGPVVFPALITIVTDIVSGVILRAIFYEGYKVFERLAATGVGGYPSMDMYSEPYGMGTAEVYDHRMAKEKAAQETTDVYAPDRPLPRDENTREPAPDTDAPHTQLGTRTSTKTGERYPQAREFGKNGKPVKDIDFTNHRRPDKHPTPHQHIWEPNKTGGTPTRSRKPEPLSWPGPPYKIRT